MFRSRLIRVPRVIPDFAKKCALPWSISVIAAAKKAPPPAELISPEVADRSISASEEQPQQDDHRNRHTDQPKQNSFSHFRLHQFLRWKENARRRVRFQRSGGKNLARREISRRPARAAARGLAS